MYVSEPSNPAKVKVYGPGVEKGVKTFTPTYFVVDCKEAGPGIQHPYIFFSLHIIFFFGQCYRVRALLCNSFLSKEDYIAKFFPGGKN